MRTPDNATYVSPLPASPGAYSTDLLALEATDSVATALCCLLGQPRSSRPCVVRRLAYGGPLFHLFDAADLRDRLLASPMELRSQQTLSRQLGLRSQALVPAAAVEPGPTLPPGAVVVQQGRAIGVVPQRRIAVNETSTSGRLEGDQRSVIR